MTTQLEIEIMVRRLEAGLRTARPLPAQRAERRPSRPWRGWRWRRAAPACPGSVPALRIAR